MKMNLNHNEKFLNFISENYPSKNVLVWELRTIDKNSKVKQEFFRNIKSMVNYIEKNSEELQNTNCYVGLLPRNKKSGNDADVVLANVLCADFDSENTIEDIDLIYKKFGDFGFRPSLMINSGHGIWLFWKLKEIINVKKWKDYQEKVIAFCKIHFQKYKVDPVIKNSSRIVRLPGSINVKDKPIKSSIVIEDYITYKIEDIEKIFDATGIKNVRKSGLSVHVKRSMNKKPMPEYTKTLIEAGAEHPYRHMTAWQITKDLWNCGWKPDKILEQVLVFNKHCKPPKKEDVVKIHIENILKPEHTKKYLEQFNEEWLKKHEYGVIEKIEEPTSVKEILSKPLPVIEYWTEPLVVKGRLIFIGGRPSCGKSLFSLALALAMSRGEKFLGEFQTNGKPKILLYDLENGEPTVHSRIRYIIEGTNLKEDDFSNFHFFEYFNKQDMKKELKRALKYDVIILDSYRRFLRGEENISEITDTFFREFLKPLLGAEKTVIITHHFRKSKPEEMSDDDLQDLFRGSSDIIAQPDLVLALFKEVEKYEDKKLTFLVNVFKAKNRLAIPLRNFQFSVTKDDELGQTSMVYLGEKRYELPEIARINTLVEFLKSGERRTRDIMEHFSNLSTRTVSRMLTDALVRGSIKSDKKGVYSLPEDVDTRVDYYA